MHRIRVQLPRVVEIPLLLEEVLTTGRSGTDLLVGDHQHSIEIRFSIFYVGVGIVRGDLGYYRIGWNLDHLYTNAGNGL